MQQMILDVDTGIDDALALMLAVRHPGVNLRAVTCVAGNASLEQVLIDNDRDNWFTAQEALEYGFVDHLREFASDVVGGGGTEDNASDDNATGKKD